MSGRRIGRDTLPRKRVGAPYEGTGARTLAGCGISAQGVEVI